MTSHEQCNVLEHLNVLIFSPYRLVTLPFTIIRLSNKPLVKHGEMGWVLIDLKKFFLAGEKTEARILRHAIVVQRITTPVCKPSILLSY